MLKNVFYGKNLQPQTEKGVLFQRDGLYKLMNVCRRSAVTRYTQEYVIISCCTAEMDELNPKYENTSTTALNVAHLTPMMPYDLSNLPGKSTNRSPIY